VETFEQQRRPTIGQSAKKLRQLGLDFDGLDLADMFWLAQFIDLGETARLEDESKPINQPAIVRRVDESRVSVSESTVNLYINDNDRETTSSEEFSTRQSSTEEIESESPKGVPFPVPAAPALRTRLDLARALRPLMRKVPSQKRYELDEDATVTRIAETQMMIPVVRSQAERWLDLDLVVEDSKTTSIWARTIAELQHLMEYQGAFRTVRTWRLAVANSHSVSPQDVQLFPRWHQFTKDGLDQRPRSPRELLDPGSRRLILFITDCTSALWWQGIVHETLWQWAEVQPISVVQLFPERLWTRTALSNGYTVRLGATTPGLPSSHLDVAGLPDLAEWDDIEDWDEEYPVDSQDRIEDKRCLVLPIVTLNPKTMYRWARVMAGSGEALSPGRFFELKTVRQRTTGIAVFGAADSRTARQRVALFKATALEPTQALAKYMAATPVSLPVIDLLRDEFVPEAQQEHVAEILLSGLLQRVDDEGDGVCRYEFFGDSESSEKTERVRDLLLDDVPTDYTVSILNRLSQLICDKAGNTLKSFEAFLAAFAESGEALGEGALPLAKVGLDVLHRLGGPHAALAKQYEQFWQKQGTRTQVPDDDFPLEDLVYEVVKLINFPQIQPCEYESATITAILDRFDFETAKIERKTRSSTKRQEWNVSRRGAVAWGYTETLSTDAGEESGLDMIAIPGGSFMMGAPESEPESDSNERPQHEVTLRTFFMGRYPVTQAQWRLVAGYDRIDRELDPDPSRFEGENRPVERVSWEDAQEFCKRLSARTGKDYRLPSEAQWEYACRAETGTPFHFGETVATELANYNGDYTYNNGLKGEYRQETTDVGLFPANEWGLHDMHGNVLEWCEDDYHSSYKDAPNDGSAWVDRVGVASPVKTRIDLFRLLRGGSWYGLPQNCRSTSRASHSRDDRNNGFGFRVCCVPPFA